MEQITCGACWLVENIDWCKTFEKGFNGYATGKCKPLGGRWKILKRFKLWKKLHEGIGK